MSLNKIGPNVFIKITDIGLTRKRYDEFVDKVLKPMHEFLDAEFIYVDCRIVHYPSQEFKK